MTLRIQLRHLPLLLLSILFLSATCDDDKDMGGMEPEPPVQPFTDTLRFATYNVSMFRNEEGQLANELSNPNNIQVQRVAAVIQEVRPDVLALQEFDYDAEGLALDRFRENFLKKSQNGGDTIHYRYAYSVPSNTGVLSGVDLNNDGQKRLPEDAFGFGNFPGQYAFALLSRYPIDTANIRSYRQYLWKDMPNAKLPAKTNGEPYYDQVALEVFRLSSKNHIDLPVRLPDSSLVHIVIAHPTPPVFDGSEDRNGLRNHDEIRLLADYASDAAYLVDDSGRTGGLATDQPFVIMGDMNADPYDGDSADDAILQLLNHPQVNPAVTFGVEVPASAGGKAHNASPGHTGDPEHDTAFFGLRVDYVLPSDEFNVIDSGVFWPDSSDPRHVLIENGSASDHLLVWVDVTLRQ